MEITEKKVTCPKCGSDQITAQKRGFNNTKAVVGGVVTGGVGLLAGLHGKDNIIVYCLGCGHSWNPKEEFKKKEKKSLQHWVKHSSVFIKYYDHDKGMAQKYAEKHELFSDQLTTINEIYKKAKSDSRAQKIVIIVLLLIIIGFALTCEN